jgi:lipopolysaccharide export LptBFGC system permease protein LptF
VSDRHLSWPLLVLAMLCLVPVVGGVALLVSGDAGGEALGWALVGFFGSGVFVLGRKAFSAG